jgi:large subunit ribosomal protein L19e
MKLDLQKRLAADILNAGSTRVWLDPEKLEDISKAITRTDVRTLIKKGLIKAKPKLGTSKGRARALKLQKQKGRRRGHGSRRGAKGARTPPKRTWMNKVRALRNALRLYKEKGLVDGKTYREMYMKVKGNFFRSVSHLKLYLDKPGK